jgi:hypothetical protein
MKYFKLFTILAFVQVNVFAQINKITSNISVSQSMHFFQQQDDSYQYREDEYDPRSEGIKSNKQQDVTSDKIELLSAKVLFDLPEQNSDSALIHLGFYTLDQVSPEVNVAYDLRNYYMDPVREQWGPGLSTFKWPSDIIVRNHIPLDELHARAVLIKGGKRRFYPVCIYFNQLPDFIQQYYFVITPLMTMEIQYQIIDANSETIIFNDSLGKVDENQIKSIIWQCIDEKGTLLKDGEYTLRLDGSYRNSIGQLKKLNVAYSFIHKSRF